MKFESRLPGKFVLAGEHSVLRGYPALALPHPDFFLDIKFEPNDQMFSGLKSLTIEPPSFKAPLDQILSALGANPNGKVRIESSIPMGAGLGSSAALCVAVSQWIHPKSDRDEVIRIATELENIFHGRSSGMDIAAVACGMPIKYIRGQKPQVLSISNLPKFTFLDTGIRKNTREMVQYVESLQKPELDRRMGEVTELAIQGLETYSYGRKRLGLEQLAQAMQEGMGCFEAWNLLPPEATALAKSAYAEGALAVKMTGAGGGGYLVALWGDST